MADIWNGDIVLPDASTVADVILTSPITTTSTPGLPFALSALPAAAALRFLAPVDPARIPLCLAAGPSLDVWTRTQATQAWFADVLLSAPAVCASGEDGGEDGDGGVKRLEWWEQARAQAPVGFLVKAEREGDGTGSRADEKDRVVITELLFYGTVSAPRGQDGPAELQVHALPLSSHLLSAHVPLPPLSPPPLLDEGDGAVVQHAQFLAPLHHALAVPSSPPVRKRDLFEEATAAKKKARSKGGEGVAAAAARGSEAQHVFGRRNSSFDAAKGGPFADGRPASAQGLSRPASRQLSRSPSVVSDGRPLSRRDTLEGQQGKRSNLSRVATVSSMQSDEPTTESRNKEALSRVVMAAMRMHGLQQRKKAKSRHASTVSGLEESQSIGDDAAAAAEDAAKDEEYKLIYHQTYKGAALALRNHIADKPLHAQSDRLRNLVEKLLVIFLTDPLAEPVPSQEPAHPVATPGGKPLLGVFGSTHGHGSPFDLPSGSRPPLARSKTEGHVHTGSPVSRRKTGGGMLGDP